MNILIRWMVCFNHGYKEMEVFEVSNNEVNDMILEGIEQTVSILTIQQIEVLS